MGLLFFLFFLWNSIFLFVLCVSACVSEAFALSISLFFFGDTVFTRGLCIFKSIFFFLRIIDNYAFYHLIGISFTKKKKVEICATVATQPRQLHCYQQFIKKKKKTFIFRTSSSKGVNIFF